MLRRRGSGSTGEAEWAPASRISSTCLQGVLHLMRTSVMLTKKPKVAHTSNMQSLLHRAHIATMVSPLGHFQVGKATQQSPMLHKAAASVQMASSKLQTHPEDAEPAKDHDKNPLVPVQDSSSSDQDTSSSDSSSSSSDQSGSSS